MGIQLVVARGCGPTGLELQNLLEARGVSFAPPTEARVSWGVGLQGNLPTLNGRVGGADKLGQLRQLAVADVRTVPFVDHMLQGGHGPVPPNTIRFPVLARKLRHTGGKDIRICLNAREAAQWLLEGWDFLSPVVPSRGEFRVWIYRRRHLASYEKVLVHPEWRRRYKKVRQFGRSYRLGWTTRLVPSEQVDRAVVDIASRAVEALGMDFGAVDVLIGEDGVPHVLEVNSAPGATEGSRFALNALADKIARWVEGGFKRRRGDENDA